LGIFVYHNSRLFFYTHSEGKYCCTPIEETNIDQNLVNKVDGSHHIYIDSSRFTLIPNIVFLASQAKDYFNLNFGNLDANERIYFTLNSAFELSNVFGIKKDIDEYRNKLPGSVFIDHFSSIILKYLKASIPSLVPFIVVTPTSVYFSLKEEMKLQQLSVGDFENETDVIYFFMAHLNSLEIKHLEAFHITILNEIPNFNLAEFEKQINGILFFKDTAMINIEPTQLFFAK